MAGVGDVVIHSPFSFPFQPSISIQDVDCVLEEIGGLVRKLLQVGQVFGRRHASDVPVRAAKLQPAPCSLPATS